MSCFWVKSLKSLKLGLSSFSWLWKCTVKCDNCAGSHYSVSAEMIYYTVLKTQQLFRSFYYIESFWFSMYHQKFSAAMKITLFQTNLPEMSLVWSSFPKDGRRESSFTLVPKPLCNTINTTWNNASVYLFILSTAWVNETDRGRQERAGGETGVNLAL